jgi:hypothetical protein
MKNFFMFICVLAIGAGIGWYWSEYQARQNARPCVMLEKQIMQTYGFGMRDQALPFEIIETVGYAKMFGELAEHGCPENKREYVGRHEALMKDLAMRGLVANSGTEIKIDMDKVGQAVEAAVQPAVNAMADFFDRVKNTKVSITVE